MQTFLQLLFWFHKKKKKWLHKGYTICVLYAHKQKQNIIERELFFTGFNFIFNNWKQSVNNRLENVIKKLWYYFCGK